MPVRPDAGDVVEFADGPGDQPGEVGDTSHAAPEPAPSLAEQRARRRHRRGIGGDVRKGAA